VANPTGGQPPLPPAPTPAPAPANHSWTEHQTPDGLKYYYNTATGTSSWECPPELCSVAAAPQPQPQPQLPSVAGLSSLGGVGGANGMSGVNALAQGIGALSMTGSLATSVAMSAFSAAPAPTVATTLPSIGPYGGAATGLGNGSGLGGANGLGGSLGLGGLGGLMCAGSDSLGGLGSLGSFGAPAVPAAATAVVVKELPDQFSSQDLQSAFSQFGAFTFCEMDEGTNSGRVGYESPLSAANAIERMNGIPVGEKKLHVAPLPF